MDANLLYVVFICVVAFLFDFVNGAIDAANSIATVVSTRVLRPIHAVGWAAFFNFVAAFLFGTHVATTMGKGIVDPDSGDEQTVIPGAIPEVEIAAKR